MKKVIGLVKANLVVVILLLVTVVSLPAMLFVSMGKSTKMQKDVQTELNSNLRKVNQVVSSVSVPTLDPGAAAIEIGRAPNQATIDALKESIQALKDERDKVVLFAMERNKEGKTPLVEGLFPEPATGRGTLLRERMSVDWFAAHGELLERFGGGSPPDPAVVTTALRVRWDRKAGALEDLGRELTDEDRAQIREELISVRLKMYADTASELAFYASDDVFSGVEPWDELQGYPTVPLAWDWQHRYWIHEDLVRAIVKANTDPVAGVAEPIQEAPIKRVLKIAVDPWDFDGAGAGRSSGSDIGALIAKDYEASITGRAGWPYKTNPLFDARYAVVEAVVSSEDLPRVLDAFSSVNLMSVIGLQVTSLDSRADLEAGYLYGSGHVVKVRLLIETLWLRSWMMELMPEKVRTVVGAPAPGEMGGGSESGSGGGDEDDGGNDGF